MNKAYSLGTALLFSVVVALTFGAVLPSAHAQVAPPMGQAEDFAVLGASAVTNTGSTVITGDVGIWPNTASSITGFPPGVVIGTVHAGDAVALQAQNDLTTAYDFVAGQACDVDLSGQDLGGLTLIPGVYCFSDEAQLTGTLNLDALGDPAAVFIFQIGSTLTTASNARVELLNGGSECNVFWQVGSSATLGTASSVAGSILALTSITLDTGANLSGQALARNGAVTLDTNAVSVCVGCPPIELTPATLPNGVLGAAYSELISADGGSAPYVYVVSDGDLPPGLTLNAASGEVSGLPTLAGSFTFSVLATDAVGCFGSQAYTIIINEVVGCPLIEVLPDSLPDTSTGSAYAETISASGGTAPYAFSVSAGSLPPGLMLSGSSPDTALLSGMTTTPGTYSFSITAEDANGCLGVQSYTVEVLAQVCPVIGLAPAGLSNIVLGQPYSQTFTASGGTAPYAISLSGGSLPPGLSLTSSGVATALLSGTPTVTGTFNFQITASDAEGCLFTRNYELIVVAQTAAISVPSLSFWGLVLLVLMLSLITFATPVAARLRNRY